MLHLLRYLVICVVFCHGNATVSSELIEDTTKMLEKKETEQANRLDNFPLKLLATTMLYYSTSVKKQDASLEASEFLHTSLGAGLYCFLSWCAFDPPNQKKSLFNPINWDPIVRNIGWISTLCFMQALDRHTRLSPRLQQIQMKLDWVYQGCCWALASHLGGQVVLYLYRGVIDALRHENKYSTRGKK